MSGIKFISAEDKNMLYITFCLLATYLKTVKNTSSIGLKPNITS